MRFNAQPITGVDISGTEMPVLAPTFSNSLSAVGSVGNPIAAHALHYGYNETNWEYVRNNTSQTLYNATLSASTTLGPFVNYNAKGALMQLDITSVPGSASTTLALKIQAIPTVGRVFTIATLLARGTSGVSALSIYPGCPVSAGSAFAQVNLQLPKNFQILASMSTGATSKDIIFALGMQYTL